MDLRKRASRKYSRNLGVSKEYCGIYEARLRWCAKEISNYFNLIFPPYFFDSFLVLRLMYVLAIY